MWVITGDGDALSIGGNHLLHALRRNVNLTIILFNNQIYGLTKGQYSPTSETGKVTKSTPFGSLDYPYNPVSLALGAEATFVARTHDMERKHMMETFRRAHEHNGAAFVEVYQNCNVFNDGAFEQILTKDARPKMLIQLDHGEPIRFGPEGEHGVVFDNGTARMVEVDEVGEDRLLVHDEHTPGSEPGLRPVPTGQRPDRPDPGRRLPPGGPAGLRIPRQPAAGQRGRAPRPRGSRRAAQVRIDLDRHLSSPEFADSRNTGRFRG